MNSFKSDSKNPENLSPDGAVLANDQNRQRDQHPERLCIVCRKMSDRDELIRLTADSISSEIKLNAGNGRVHGRSAYLCKQEACIGQALKGTRLKAALEGRKGKNVQNRRTVKWPLEPQLIQEIFERCTEPPKTCQNTER